MDYALPRARDVPAFSFETRNVKCATNALGVNLDSLFAPPKAPETHHG